MQPQVDPLAIEGYRYWRSATFLLRLHAVETASQVTGFISAMTVGKSSDTVG